MVVVVAVAGTERRLSPRRLHHRRRRLHPRPRERWRCLVGTSIRTPLRTRPGTGAGGGCGGAPVSRHLCCRCGRRAATTTHSPTQRGAPLRNVGQELRQHPPQDAVVRCPRSPPLTPLCLDVLVDVPQGREASPFPAERHGADQEGQLGHGLLGLGGGLGGGGAAAAAPLPLLLLLLLLREEQWWVGSLALLAGALPLVAQHGGEAGVGGGAAALAGADEVAVLVALALAQALVAGLVVVVLVVVEEVVVVVVAAVETVVVEVVVAHGGAVQALGGGEGAVVQKDEPSTGTKSLRSEAAASCSLSEYSGLARWPWGTARAIAKPPRATWSGSGSPRGWPSGGLRRGCTTSVAVVATTACGATPLPLVVSLPLPRSSSSRDSTEKRRLGKLGVAPPPLLAPREEEPPGVLVPDGPSPSPRLGMDLDFWMSCSYSEMRVGTTARGTSPPPPPSTEEEGGPPPQGKRWRRRRCGWRSSSRMRARTERMTSEGSSWARSMWCILRNEPTLSERSAPAPSPGLEWPSLSRSSQLRDRNLPGVAGGGGGGGASEGGGSSEPLQLPPVIGRPAALQAAGAPGRGAAAIRAAVPGRGAGAAGGGRGRGARDVRDAEQREKQKKKKKKKRKRGRRERAAKKCAGGESLSTSSSSSFSTTIDRSPPYHTTTTRAPPPPVSRRRCSTGAAPPAAPSGPAAVALFTRHPPSLSSELLSASTSTSTSTSIHGILRHGARPRTSPPSPPFSISSLSSALLSSSSSSPFSPFTFSFHSLSLSISSSYSSLIINPTPTTRA
ncbi:hypothetical protein CRUP_017499 [Coryphaenoides rupestris]|nr:hypothetical protein CRUP_017499 [Coryphaenoides rupestris]